MAKMANLIIKKWSVDSIGIWTQDLQHLHASGRRPNQLSYLQLQQWILPDRFCCWIAAKGQASIFLKQIYHMKTQFCYAPIVLEPDVWLFTSQVVLEPKVRPDFQVFSNLLCVNKYQERERTVLKISRFQTVENHL